jgi:hypothetical protein
LAEEACLSDQTYFFIKVTSKESVHPANERQQRKIKDLFIASTTTCAHRSWK